MKDRQNDLAMGEELRPSLFVPSLKQKPVRWLVKGLIPLGDGDLLASQPGAGKTFFTQGLATAIAYSKPFLGFDVIGGNVLIVDEDTPTASLNWRLSMFSNYYQDERQHAIYTHSQEGYTLDTLPKLINSYSNLRLVVIDCLVAISGDLDPDKTVHAAKIGHFLQNIKSKDKTVLVNHHISTHSDLSVEQAMSCLNPQNLVMNNTRIVSASDTLYILASPDAGEKLKTLMIRPVSRRTAIPAGMFSASLVELKDSLHLEYGKVISPRLELSRSESRALNLFKVGDPFTVKVAIRECEQFFSEYQMREVLASLEDKGYLEMPKKGARGHLIYRRIK